MHSIGIVLLFSSSLVFHKGVIYRKRTREKKKKEIEKEKVLIKFEIQNEMTHVLNLFEHKRYV